MLFKYLLFLCLVSFVNGMIEGTEESYKPERYATVGYPVLVDGFAVDVQQRSDGTDEIEELPVPSLAHIYRGRFRRAIQDPIADFLDEKAASDVFKDIHPPAPPKFSDLQNNPNFDSDSDFLFDDRITVRPSVPTSTAMPQGPPPTSPNSNTGREMKPFDFNVDPDFPVNAPRARGLVNIPEGWNNDKTVDQEFRQGFRWNFNNLPAQSPARTFDIGLAGRSLDQSSVQQAS
ncbi:unnamed protein product [Auanema sp. JU1783]|nr:unnamed protein product [Auanema sp. JU1783]